MKYTVALAAVATLALHWFMDHLVPAQRRWSGADMMP